MKKLYNISKSVLQYSFGIRTKPVNLQLPVTSKCNSRCVTCNVWKLADKQDIEPLELKRILTDPYFSKIQHVGLNGGEITLYKDIDGLLDAVFSLKKLKKVHVISNSILTNKLLSLLEHCKKRCDERGVKLGFTISIDGIDETQDFVRGVPGHFVKTMNGLNQILENRSLYCDDIHIGCTISKYNIPYITEIESYYENYKVPIIYHLAVPNKRIGTFEDHSYSVLSDERSRLLAAEFFLSKFLKKGKIFDMFFNFGNYYYLINNGTRRISICTYRYRDVTIDEQLNFYLCATASNCIGSLHEITPTKLKKNGKIKAIQKQISPLCNSCIHYQGGPSIKGIFVFLRFAISRYFMWRVKFKLLAKWSK